MKTITPASQFPIMLLPNDTLEHIYKVAGPRTVNKLGATCKEANRLADNFLGWPQFFTQHIGPMPHSTSPAPMTPRDARRAFAAAAPVEAPRLATTAFLNTLPVKVSMVAVDDDQPHASSEILRALMHEAGMSRRTVHCISVTSLKTAADVDALRDGTDILLIDDLEAASPVNGRHLASLIDAKRNDADCRIVMLHTGDADACDAALVSRAQPRAYRPEDAKKFPDPCV